MKCLILSSLTMVFAKIGCVREDRVCARRWDVCAKIILQGLMQWFTMH